MDTHIINLLKTNNRVIIPEFGAFIVKSGSPRTIVFNEFLKYNDEVLLKEICRAENVSEEEGAKKLDEFTRELNSQLDLGQHHKVGTLGLLSKDANERIHFKMFNEAEVSNEAEALAKTKKEPGKKVELEEIIPLNEEKKEPTPGDKMEVEKEEEKKEDLTKEESKNEEVKKENDGEKKGTEEKIIPVSASNEKKKTLTVNEKLKTSPKQQPKDPKQVATPPKAYSNKEKASLSTYLNNNKNVVWYALVGVILVVITIWFFANKEYLFDSSDIKKMAEGDEVVIQPKSDVQGDTEAGETTDETGGTSGNTDETKENTSTTKDNAAATKTIEKSGQTSQIAPKSQPGAKQYYIVAGCFQQESNADNYVDYLNAQGYNSEKFGKYGGLYAVSFNSFSSYSDAQKELNKIKKSTEPGAWILYY